LFTASAPPAGQRLIAKFNYNAKPDSPLGQSAELSLHIMDKMTMIGPHRLQEYWWLVKMDDGRQGYVPANYVQVQQCVLHLASTADSKLNAIL
jgi:Variant SH3 domain